MFLNDANVAVVFFVVAFLLSLPLMPLFFKKQRARVVVVVATVVVVVIIVVIFSPLIVVLFLRARDIKKEKRFIQKVCKRLQTFRELVSPKTHTHTHTAL